MYVILYNAAKTDVNVLKLHIFRNYAKISDYFNLGMLLHFSKKCVPKYTLYFPLVFDWQCSSLKYKILFTKIAPVGVN